MNPVRSLIGAMSIALAFLFSVAAFAADAPAKAKDGVLVDEKGMTLYVFDKDGKGSGKSACNGQCATLWPPLLADKDAAPKGDWSIVTRDDGKRQWAYKGQPLYRYQSDKKPGDRTGDNVKNIWHVVAE